MSNKFAVFLANIPSWIYNLSFVISNACVIAFFISHFVFINVWYVIFDIIEILFLAGLIGTLLSVLLGGIRALFIKLGGI